MQCYVFAYLMYVHICVHMCVCTGLLSQAFRRS